MSFYGFCIDIDISLSFLVFSFFSVLYRGLEYSASPTQYIIQQVLELTLLTDVDRGTCSPCEWKANFSFRSIKKSFFFVLVLLFIFVLSFFKGTVFSFVLFYVHICSPFQLFSSSQDHGKSTQRVDDWTCTTSTPDFVSYCCVLGSFLCSLFCFINLPSVC